MHHTSLHLNKRSNMFGLNTGSYSCDIEFMKGIHEYDLDEKSRQELYKLKKDEPNERYCIECPVVDAYPLDRRLLVNPGPISLYIKNIKITSDRIWEDHTLFNYQYAIRMMIYIDGSVNTITQNISQDIEDKENSVSSPREFNENESYFVDSNNGPWQWYIEHDTNLNNLNSLNMDGIIYIDTELVYMKVSIRMGQLHPRDRTNTKVKTVTNSKMTTLVPYKIIEK